MKDLAPKEFDIYVAAVRELWRKLTGKERTQAEEAAYRLEKAYEKAVKEAKKNATQTGGGERLSIENLGGEMITVIDTKNDTRQYDAAEAYLNALVNAEYPFSTVLRDSLPVYLGKDLPGEYKSSEYTKNMDRRLHNVKMQVATNLDEMLLLADDGEWRENVKAKHAVDAKNGWYRYETQFAVPILNAQKVVDHYTVYSGTLLIRNDADGKSYLYDLVNIAKKKVISASSFSAKTHSEVKPPKPSDANVTHPAQNVKAKFSLKEQQFQTIQKSKPGFFSGNHARKCFFLFISGKSCYTEENHNTSAKDVYKNVCRCCKNQDQSR